MTAHFTHVTFLFRPFLHKTKRHFLNMKTLKECSKYRTIYARRISAAVGVNFFRGKVHATIQADVLFLLTFRLSVCPFNLAFLIACCSSSVCPSVRLSENFLYFHLLLSRTSEPMSTKLSKEHSWIKWIQVCSKEGPRPFSRGDNIAKMQNHGNFQLNLVKSIHGWTELKFV